MKRQIRNGVFESNSSSIHSIVLCMESDYNKWWKENLFLFDGYGGSYFGETKPERNHFYTKEEAITFIKNSKYPPSKDFDWNDEDSVMKLLHEYEWYDYDYYWDVYCENYEVFEETTKTPTGEGVVAFGYYGSDY